MDQDISIEQQREAVESQLSHFRQRRWSRNRDLKGWERMLGRAEGADGLRAGRRVKEAAASAKQEIRKEIASCLFDIERLDIGVEDCLADLKELDALEAETPAEEGSDGGG